MAGGQSDIYAETLATFDGREPRTTPEVAAALDAERRTVYERLRTLVDRGDLETKSVGSNARVWWRPAPEAAGGGEAPRERRTRAMESVFDGMAVLDEDGTYRQVNETHAAVYGYDDPSAFVGESWRMCYGDAELERFDAEILPTLRETGAWRGETVGRRKDGTTFPQDLSLTVTDDGSTICVVRDVTDRTERERRLQEARRFTEELVENAPFGIFRLDEDLRITYENPRAKEIVGLPEDRETSDALGVPIDELPSVVETGRAEIFSRLQSGETVEFDFPFESIYGTVAYFAGRAVPLYREGEFDGAVLMATDISDRRRRERKLERQREQLAALDELNDAVRGITEAVVEQSTRAEIERVVCERLAASDSYRFAWIGAVDSARGLEPRVEAGVDGYLDSLSYTSDEDADEYGPAGTAVRTREMQIVRHALEDADSPHVFADASEFGYRSSAVIPIVHQGMFYGVLGVCSNRPDAFAEAEREVVGQLGDVIGHAIAAVDRKRALMGDEVVELDVRIPNLVDVADADWRVDVDRVTPLDDDACLVYGTATTNAVPVLETLLDRRAHWNRLRTFDETDRETRFELRLTDPPMTSVVADHGGNVERGWIEDGEYGATVQFPPGTDVSRVVERMRETDLHVEIRSRRQVVRDEPSSRRLGGAFADDLTERQRTALEAAYFGGFFEWPRPRTGEEVAESLGIGASTFHQHIRKAEGKLLDVVFGDR